MRIACACLLAALVAAIAAAPALAAPVTADPGAPGSTPAPTADLQVTNAASASTAPAGSTVSYTIAVKDAGPSDAQGVMLSDALPSGTTFVSLTSPHGWTPTTPPPGTNGTVSATAPTLAAGSTATFVLTVKTDPGTPDPTLVDDTATVSTTTSDPDSGNNSATASVWVGTKADLAVGLTADADSVARGANLTYTITLTNSGVDAADVALTDAAPGGTFLVSAAQTDGDQAFSVSAPDPGRTGTVTFSLDDMRPGGSATFEVVVRVTASPGSTVTDTASASTSTPEAQTTNDSASAATTVSRGAPPPPPGTIVDLHAVGAATPAAVRHGRALRVRFRVSNRGDLQATGTRLTAAVPRGLTLVRAISNGGECARGSRIVCDLATIVPRRTVTVTATLRVMRRGRFTVRGRASCRHADARPRDNVAVVRLRGR